MSQVTQFDTQDDKQKKKNPDKPIVKDVQNEGSRDLW